MHSTTEKLTSPGPSACTSGAVTAYRTTYRMRLKDLKDVQLLSSAASHGSIAWLGNRKIRIVDVRHAGTSQGNVDVSALSVTSSVQNTACSQMLSNCSLPTSQFEKETAAGIPPPKQNVKYSPINISRVDLVNLLDKSKANTLHSTMQPATPASDLVTEDGHKTMTASKLYVRSSGLGMSNPCKSTYEFANLTARRELNSLELLSHVACNADAINQEAPLLSEPLSKPIVQDLSHADTDSFAAWSSSIVHSSFSARRGRKYSSVYRASECGSSKKDTGASQPSCSILSVDSVISAGLSLGNSSTSTESLPTFTSDSCGSTVGSRTTLRVRIRNPQDLERLSMMAGDGKIGLFGNKKVRIVSVGSANSLANNCQNKSLFDRGKQQCKVIENAPQESASASLAVDRNVPSAVTRSDGSPHNGSFAETSKCAEEGTNIGNPYPNMTFSQHPCLKSGVDAKPIVRIVKSLKAASPYQRPSNLYPKRLDSVFGLIPPGAKYLGTMSNISAQATKVLDAISQRPELAGSTSSDNPPSAAEEQMPVLQSSENITTCTPSALTSQSATSATSNIRSHLTSSSFSPHWLAIKPPNFVNTEERPSGVWTQTGKKRPLCHSNTDDIDSQSRMKKPYLGYPNPAASSGNVSKVMANRNLELKLKKCKAQSQYRLHRQKYLAPSAQELNRNYRFLYNNISGDSQLDWEWKMKDLVLSTIGKGNFDLQSYIEYHRSQSACDDQCARMRPFCWPLRRKRDTFSFLSSSLREKPGLDPNCAPVADYCSGKRPPVPATDVPLASQFHQLGITSRRTVGVYRSAIHGLGLYARRGIGSGDMIVEYAGEVIRSLVADVREQRYDAAGVGCYMFRRSADEVIDATRSGNVSRFINHSCEPNCFSRQVTIAGRRHILIFALKDVRRGEELTYDYKFPREQVKVPCYCGAQRCRKYLN